MFKSAFLISVAATAVLAAPAELQKRQSTQNDLANGNGCKDVAFIFARGSTETGNMGTIVGPPVANGLKAMLGADNVAVQGVDYAAALSTNFGPNNADPKGVAKMASLLQQVSTQCPKTKIVAGGYSQGAAVTHAAIGGLDQATKDQIVGVAMFGDTRNQQEMGMIAGYPKAQTKIICNAGDPVCSGTLTINAAHLAYANRASEGSTFLAQMVQAAGAK